MLSAVLKKEVLVSKLAVRIIGIVFFMLCTALGAFVRIPLPFTPVPVTLQTFFVLLSGACLGAGAGILSQAGYVLLGLWGVPLFSGYGSGYLYLTGPTTGYLAGFVVSSFLIGRFIRLTKNNIALTMLLMFAADMVILGCGLLWLKVLLRQSFSYLIGIGVIPFIIPDIIKVMAAAGLYHKFKPHLGVDKGFRL